MYGPISSRLLLVARLRLLTLVAVDASLDQVPRGQRAPLDQFRSADRPVSGIGGVSSACSWQTLAPQPAGTRLTTPSCCVPPALSLQGPCADLSFSSVVTSDSFRACPRSSPSVHPYPILSCSCHTALLLMPAASGYSSTATFCWQSGDSHTYTSCSSGVAGV